MKTPHLSPRQPRRQKWRRGVFFGACATLGAGVLAVWSRALGPSLAAWEEAPLPLAAREAKRPGSLASNLAKIDAETVRAYLERWTNASQSPVADARRVVYIDAELLARRHPAWRLADQLERGAISPSSPRIARVLKAATTEKTLANVPLGAALLSAPRAVAGVILSGNGANIPPPTRQNQDLDRFLAASAARDASRARDEAWLARRALEDATSTARRSAVPEVDLPLLPPEIALELVNLRLALLRNLARTPLQRAAAREEIRVIEARYAAVLQRQSDLQAARLRAATIDNPARLQREKQLEIERQTRITTRKGAPARRDLALESQNRWRRDAANEPPLRLALPPALPPFLAPRDAEKSTFSRRAPEQKAQIIETARRAAPSNAPLGTLTASSRQRQTIAGQLRLAARRQATEWARRSAVHLGATWSNIPNPTAKVPDATARALEIVFPRAEN